MRGLYVLALLSILTRAAPGRAEQAAALPLDLSWSAPPECASAAEIHTELARIARVRPGRSIARVTAQGQIERRGDSYRLSLRTERNGVIGERSLVASECRSLAREVTLVLAVAFGEGVELVEPDTNRAPLPSRDATDANAPAAIASEPSNAAAPARAERANPNPNPHAPQSAAAPDASTDSARPILRHAAALIGAGVLFGTLPSPAAVVTAGGELGFRHVWFEPRLWWIPHVGDALERGVQARYDGFGGALATCLGREAFASSISACLGADALALRARSAGPNESGHAIARFLAGALTLAWEWPTRGLVALRFDAQLHVAIEQPRFLIEGLGEVHRASRFSPSLAFALVLWPGR